MINILLVTTWDTACGIAEHSALLKEHVEAADSEIRIIPKPEALNPEALAKWSLDGTDRIVHLNYQAALHSRWTPEQIRRMQIGNRKVIVTYHDTGVPNSDQCKAIVDAADVTIVHEPCDDLPTEKIRYWRMGVPDWPHAHEAGLGFSWRRQHPAQPTLGSIGFPFPWKNYDQLARVTSECGWALFLIGPKATPEQIRSWQQLNPNLEVQADFVPRQAAINLLHHCDATAFVYTCANTGQSGAILQGIAARKPVIALKTCRQFRALYEEYPGSIHWISSFDRSIDSLESALTSMPIARVDPRTVYIAEQESWTKLGAKYAALYREVLA